MIEGCVPVSAKKEFLQGIHSATDIYKIALYTGKAKLGKTTAEYSSVNEAEGKGYEAGGKVLAGYQVSEDKEKAILSFANPTWENASVTAKGFMIYNASKENRAVVVVAFEEEGTSTNGEFTVIIPPASAKEGLIRFS